MQIRDVTMTVLKLKLIQCIWGGGGVTEQGKIGAMCVNVFICVCVCVYTCVYVSVV